MPHKLDLQIDFENLVANLADGIFFANPQGMILYANQGLSDLLGYRSPSSLLGKSLYDFLEPSYLQKVREFTAHENPERFGASRFEVQLVCSDGSYVWAEVRPTFNIPKPSTRGIFGVIRDITEFKVLEERLRNLAITDDLTCLHNRRGFRLLAEQELRHAQRINAETILLSIDVDDFKNINDTLGHDEGDKMLKLVATTLSETFRRTDIISRWGGDEFLVLALDAPSGLVTLLTERFQQNLATKVQEMLLPYPLSVTIGMDSTRIFENSTLDGLIKRADRHMYLQKKEKRCQ